MHMNLNYARHHWTKPGENPPLGLILCAEKGAEEARYALENLPTRFLRQSGHTFALYAKSAKPLLCSGRSRFHGRRLKLCSRPLLSTGRGGKPTTSASFGQRSRSNQVKKRGHVKDTITMTKGVSGC